MLFCGKQLSRYPYRMSPFSVAVNFVSPSSIATVCLQGHALQKFLCHMKCYQKLPQYLGNLKCNIWFSTAYCICVITWCIAVSVDFPDI